MTGDELPEDPAHWPADPFAILGVSHTATPAEVRQKYVQLIRRFKPEHAPEAFRRIREAYDTVRQRAAWNARRKSSQEDARNPASDPFDDAEQARPRQQPTETDAAATSPARSDDGSPRSRRSTHESESLVDEAWSLVCRGYDARAYRLLQARCEQSPRDFDSISRIFWVLTLNPSLDHRRVPLDYVFEGLSSKQLSTPLLELLLTGLRMDESECVSGRVRQLLVDERLRRWLPALCELRWRAAIRAGEWEVVFADLEMLQTACLDEAIVWANVNLKFLRMAAYEHDNVAAIKHCRRVFREFNAVLEFDWVCDQADGLFNAAKEMRILRHPQTGPDRIRRDLLAPLERLIVNSYDGEDGRGYGDLRRNLEDWVRSPQDTLERLNVLFSAFPVLAYQLTSRVNDLYFSSRWRTQILDGEELQAAIRREADSERAFYRLIEGLADYAAARRTILRFCLKEFADFDSLTNELSDIQSTQKDRRTSIAKKVANDTALRCLVHGCLAFWTAS